MTDTADTTDTAEWLTDTDDTVEEVIPRDDGPDMPIEVREITEAELEAIEEKSQQGPADEAEAIREAINEYLVEPGVDAADIPMGKRSKLFLYMNLAWSGASEMEAAMEQLDLPDQGNR